MRGFLLSVAVIIGMAWSAGGAGPGSSPEEIIAEAARPAPGCDPEARKMRGPILHVVPADPDDGATPTVFDGDLVLDRPCTVHPGCNAWYRGRGTQAE